MSDDSEASLKKQKGLNDTDHSRTLARLITEGVPPEWALLIADRAINPYMNGVGADPAEYLLAAFVWDRTIEGHDYWRSVYDSLCAELELESQLRPTP
jgi:hypothetical protein